jgi:hypothetical protein
VNSRGGSLTVPLPEEEEVLVADATGQFFGPGNLVMDDFVGWRHTAGEEDKFMASGTPTTFAGSLSSSIGCSTSPTALAGSFSSSIGASTPVSCGRSSRATIGVPPSHVLSMAKSMDKQFAKAYEQHISQMVKDQQQKSRKKLS